MLHYALVDQKTVNCDREPMGTAKRLMLVSLEP